MHCMVFGGAGFLGEHICKGLLNKDYEVIVYDRGSDKLNKMKEKYPAIKYIEGDFIAEEDFIDVLKDVHIVFHLISTTVPSNTDVIWDISSNVIPTVRLLESCVKSDVKKIVYFSSGGTVYGIPQAIPIEESHLTDPICPYGIHKLAIEKYFHFYKHNYGLNYNIMRIANPYGEGQAAFGTQGVIAAFLARALLGEPLQIWGDSGTIRDFIYIQDVVDASLAILEYGGYETIFNIGSGKGTSLQDIISEIRYIVDRNIVIKQEVGRRQDVPVNILNISKAKNELNWYPKVGLHEGIRRMYNSWDARSRNFLLA